jgi:hypothetical protein
MEIFPTDPYQHLWFVSGGYDFTACGKIAWFARVKRQSREIIEPSPVRAGIRKRKKPSPGAGVPNAPDVGAVGWRRGGTLATS